MRLLTIGVAVVASAAATFLAIAQQNPNTLPARPASMLRPDAKLMPIDWAEVREAVKNQRLQRAANLKMAIAANAPRPSLPLLLPIEQRIAAAKVNVFPKPDAYAASMRMDDITIEIHGERRAIVLAKEDPLARISRPKLRMNIAGATVPLAIDKTEGGFDVTFSRFGGAYLVAIECKNPETDERCTKPDFIKALAERMALAGSEQP